MDDEFVAQLLAKEAKESSIKYSTQGPSAFISSKPASNAPKPNTRFLRNLIKVTDSHNTALKLKEEKEARERMRQLKYSGSGVLAPPSTDHASTRSVSRSDVRGPREHHRREEREDGTRSHRKRDRSRSPSRERSRERQRRHRRRDEDYARTAEKGRDRDGHRRSHRDHESSGRDRRYRDKDHTRRRHDRSYSRSTSHSPRRDRSSDRHHRRGRHREPAHSTRSRSRSRESYKTRRSKVKDASPKASQRHNRLSPPPTRSTYANGADYESDPLEELIGPLPLQENKEPVRSRGRGAYKPNLSNIDAHFAPDYNPNTDVHLDDDNLHSAGQPSSRRPVAGLMTKDDDWDMAMEALRDRERWRQKGAERLRTAGFDEAAIEKWKAEPAFAGLDGEGKPEDVQWAKKGEGREWDRGKFVNDEGHIDIRAPW
ncbi:hypothetical protein N7535_007509 [Penicillium sp. DV-2018c]|nr:hypothetical protein N7461_003534 [Penicillium sp. DV-2018c]KAJ5565871.1 hypothetical protein N7535_007509 [Penicillium sp. DV-2018c]